MNCLLQTKQALSIMENQRSSKRASLQALANSNGLINNMNLDLTENILFQIPIEFVSRGRAVCKLWRTLLPKPKAGFLFAVGESETPCEQIQLFHGYSEEVSTDAAAPVSYKTLARLDLGLGISRDGSANLICNEHCVNPVMYGSCNGLVCCPVVRKDDAKCVVYVCNPMTGEYVHLPEMDSGDVSRPGVFGGFGYCQSTNEYKVVQVTYEYYKFKYSGTVQVYTLGGGNGWRNKGQIRYAADERLVYANEALYWLERIDEDDHKLNVFDLADETFRTLRMPPCHDVISCYKSVVSLSGFLCLYHVTVEKCVEDEEEDFMREEDTRIDMWILKKEQKKKMKNVGYYYPADENDDSNPNPWVWIKEFSMVYNTEFPDHMEYEPFAITDDNQVLMWENWYVRNFKCLVRYDRDTGSRRKALWNESFEYVQAIPHMNSFVSLKDLGEKSARYIPNDSELVHTTQKQYD